MASLFHQSGGGKVEALCSLRQPAAGQRKLGGEPGKPLLLQQAQLVAELRQLGAQLRQLPPNGGNLPGTFYFT